MDDCLFCKIINGHIPSSKVYEDEHVYAFLDISPVNIGHTLVIPKKHVKNLYEMDDETTQQVFTAVKNLAEPIKRAVHADGINLEMNNDAVAGQVIFHAHVHIVPRFETDGFKHWKGTPYKEGQMQDVLKKIQSQL